MPKQPDPLTSFIQRGMAAQKAADDIIAAEKAFDTGWNLGEMAGGTPLDAELNPYTDPRLQKAFAAGWTDGQACWLEKNGG